MFLLLIRIRDAQRFLKKQDCMLNANVYVLSGKTGLKGLDFTPVVEKEDLYIYLVR